MTRRPHKSFRFGLLLLMSQLQISSVPASAGATGDGKLPTLPRDVSNFLNWLPPDSETLTVYRSFRLPRPLSDYSPSPGLTREEFQRLSEKLILKAWYGLSVLPLEAIGDRQIYKSLVGEKILLAVEGSRNSRRPEGEAGYRYDGCHILKFANNVGPKVSTCLTALQSENISVEGFSVYVCDSTWGREFVPIYFVIPKPDLLLVATDKTYLTELLKRLRFSKSAPACDEADRAFPPSLQEWKYVDTRQSIWAIRHFRRPSQDDQSPFYRPADNCPKGPNQDPDAIGIAVQYDRRKPSSFVLKYISTAKQLPWPGLKEGVADTVFRHEGICWTIRSGKFSKDDEFYMALGLLGHAMLGT